MATPDSGRAVLDAFIRTFRAQKHLADSAITQVSDEHIRLPLDANTNSVCVIMKHVSGNLRSRFTEFLTSDGEKSWRDRDDEFIDTFASREEMLATWEEGWQALFDSLNGLTPDDLTRAITIRGESHTVILSLTRALGHVSYHIGQIVQTSRYWAKDNWTTITVAKGASRAHNLKLGFDPRRPA